MTPAETIQLIGAVTAFTTPLNTFLTYLIVRRQSATRELLVKTTATQNAVMAHNTALTAANGQSLKHLHECVEAKAEEIKAVVTDATLNGNPR